MYRKIFLILLIILMFTTSIYATEWKPVNYSNPDLIKESGLTVEEFNQLTQAEWLTIIGDSKKLLFAFHAIDSTGKDITKEINPDVLIKVFGAGNSETTKFPDTSYENEAPYFINLENKIIVEADKFIYQLTAADPNRDETTFKLLNPDKLPDGLTMEQGLITWQTDYQDEGIYDLIIEVSDGKLSNESSFTLTVNHKNASPELEALGVQKVNENELIEFDIPAQDIDGDILTFGSDNLPEGASLSGEGRFSWKPDYTDSGEYTFNVKVDDGTNLVSRDYIIEVLSVNAPPVIEDIPDQTINENEDFSYQIKVNDIDGDNLTYSIENIDELPEGISISNNGLIKWDVLFYEAGSYNIDVRISDTSYSINDSFNVIVHPTSDYGMYFNGINNDILLQNQSSLKVSKEISFSAWSKPQTTSDRRTIILVGRDINSGYNLYIDKNNHWTLRLWGDKRSFVSDLIPVSINKWQHVAVTYKSGEGGAFYLNGKKKYDIPDLGDFVYEEMYGTGATIGSHGGIYYYKGDMKDITIWNTKLNQDQIKDIMNEEHFENSLNLKLHYPMK
jgi:hypothetical protein